MNRYWILFFCTGLYWTTASHSLAQSRADSAKQDKAVSFAGLALPARSPENGFYVQGGIIALFKTDRKDSTLRTSNVYLFGLYSQLRQYRISIGGDVFTKKEKYYVNAWYYHSYLPEAYFGTGTSVSPETSEFIDYRLWYMNTNVLRKVYHKWFAGISYTYERLYDLSIPENGIAWTQKPTGMENYSVSAPGLTIRHDSRDYIISATKGMFFDVHYNFFRTGLGSSYSFDQFSLDARKFINLTPNKYTILAFNVLLKQSSGDVPFRYLSNITARGYHPNLYRDNSLVSIQTECRFRIWNWIGASVFGGFSETASAPDKINLHSLRENYGGGLRLRVIKKHNMYLRIEYGASRNSSNYYVSFYDAF